MEADDFWGAKFTLASAGVEVSARLRELVLFDGATAELWAEVRELNPPYDVAIHRRHIRWTLL